MVAEIISIGDELLIGQTINTNASWIGSELSLLGIRVKWVDTISDSQQDIIDTIDLALTRSDLVVVTGGLGPTKDDITKHTLCSYFNTDLVINEEVLARVKEYFEKRGREMLDVNVQQAALPRSCEVIHNFYGTACGMWFEKNGKILISLPGVPYEMKGMMKDEVLGKIQNYFQAKALYHKTILTTGIGESYLADQIEDWERRVLDQGFGLAYLPSPGLVKLRLTSYNGKQDSEKIELLLKEVEDRFPANVYGYEEDTLPQVIGKLLLEQNKTLGTVESCTGGGVSGAIVSIPGSSAYYLGSLITYSYDLKTKLAGVNSETLLNYGAVSMETVIEMARGGKQSLGVDYCISISGVAGPDGGMPDKPVGTVWMAIAHENGCETKKLMLGDNRERNIQMTIFAALNMLRVILVSKKK
jgi:nicotinamide-nucleotide amidase